MAEFTARLNDIEYIYNVTLFNNKDKVIALSQDAIQLLVIEDSVLDPFTEGYFILDNPAYALQKKTKTDDEDVEALFDFNLANKDYLSVEIIPKFFPEQKKGDINDEVFNLNYLFVIYDIEDIQSQNIGGTTKKISFMDYHKFELLNQTSNFSTATIQKKNDIPEYKRDDIDRSEKTGLTIKEILKDGLREPKFSKEWDEGKNLVFYTSPINNSYLDDMEYIYSLHQGSVDSDLCILDKQRYTETWSLTPFEDIVSKALKQSDPTKSGVALMEAFVLADIVEQSAIPEPTRVPTDYGVLSNVSYGDLSKIENYKLFEVANQDKIMDIQTKISHSYDFQNGKFKIEHYDIKDTKKYYDDKYVSKLNSKESLFKINNIEFLNKNIEHKYACSYTPENTLEFLTRNKTINSQIFLGLAIEFNITGMTNRQAGKFFSIRKEHKYYENEYEKKLQGIWFCTSVTHVFKPMSYETNLVGVKINYS